MHRSARLSLSFASLLALLVAGSVPAFAQKASPPAQPEAPPADTSARGGQRLDKLFEKLKESESPTAARIVASDIERAFERSGSATVDLLFTRAVEAMNSRDHDLALDLFDYIVSLRPQWAEAFHRRAMIHFLRRDMDAAYRDIREALSREPRHYLALAGLGGIMGASGNKKAAFKAFTKALEIHPFLPSVKEQLERLKPDIEGQPI